MNLDTSAQNEVEATSPGTGRYKDEVKLAADIGSWE
jgi:hypothetical protein